MSLKSSNIKKSKKEMDEVIEEFEDEIEEVPAKRYLKASSPSSSPSEKKEIKEKEEEKKEEKKKKEKKVEKKKEKKDEEEEVEEERADVTFKLTEEVDLQKLKIIRDNFEEVFRRIGSEVKVYDVKTQTYVETNDWKQCYSVIKKLYDAKKKSTTVIYGYANKVKYGRRFAKTPSLQGTIRQIRHTIAKDLYWDLDFKNCHPCIEMMKSKEMNFQNDQLEDYIECREEVFREYEGKQMKKWIWTDLPNKIGHYQYFKATRDRIKQGILAMLNGGANQFVEDPSGFAKAFKEKQIQFMNEFKNYRKYPKHNKYVKRVVNKEYNKDGSCLNYYFCDIEDQLLQHVESILKEKGIRYGALCFDGLMVYKRIDPDQPEEISLQDMNVLITEINASLLKTFGYPFTLSVKEMNEEISLAGLEAKNDLEKEDADYGNYILSQIEDDLKYHSEAKQLYRYDEKSKLWRPIEMESLMAFMPEILAPLIEKSPEVELREAELKAVKNTVRQKNILTQIKVRLFLRNDDRFITSTFDRKKGVFPLKDNMVIDFRTLEVRPRVREDYFTKTTEREFKENYDVEKVKRYFESLLTSESKGKPSEEYRRNLELLIAYSLTGENNLKILINCIGDGNNGKSVFIELIHKIFHGFSTQGQKRTFIAQKNSSVHDAEAIPLINARLVSLLELSSNESFNQEFIKAITGGDTQKLRNCGSTNTLDVLFACVLWIGTNELPQFPNAQLQQRMKCINFANTFEKNPKYVDQLYSDEMLDDVFTHLCYAAKEYYENDRSIDFCEEIENYTEQMKKSQDSFLRFLEEQEDFVFDEQRKYDVGDISREEISFQYEKFCTEQRMIRKTKFYSLFEAHYKLPEAVKRQDGRFYKGVFRSGKNTE